jgi:hypothetical protein
MKRQYLMMAVLAAALVLPAVPAGADNVIYNGSDFWWTRGDGSTFSDFNQEPIPAGFFCGKSAPFTGRIVYQGVPLNTIGGKLGKVDTIVQRLDDATFNKNGVAATRIQMRALHLESVAPLKTACGKFNVVVRLEGEQPVTRMRIQRHSEDGGRFIAPIAVNVRMSFVPVSGKVREPLEITRSIRFQPVVIPWAFRSDDAKSFSRAGIFLVDTDVDGRPDTYLPGSSNFVAGMGSSQNKYETTPTLRRDDTYDEDGYIGWSHEAPAHVHTTAPPPSEPTEPTYPTGESFY